MKTDMSSPIDKMSIYLHLIEARKGCELCSDICNPGRVDSGKLDEGSHIGPWTDWQGNLNAEVMVVGQEWGGTANYTCQHGRDLDQDPTNRNLVDLLSSIGLVVPSASACQAKSERGLLFFTNAVLCLRKGNATGSGKVPALQTFQTCGSTFLRKQIELVEPKIVLVLGKLAWYGLMHAYARPIRIPTRLKAVVEDGPTQLTDRTWAVPLFHCGSKSNMNRPIAQQTVDWSRVKGLLNLNK